MAVSSFNRELSVSIAKLANQAQRYDDMAEIMKNVAKSVVELTAEERILLSEAYKKKVSSRGAFLKILSSNAYTTDTNLRREHWEKVEAEMSDICRDILCILDQHLIPSSKTAGDPTSGPFYYKMKEDYNRYLAEFIFGSAKKGAADEAIQSYDAFNWSDIYNEIFGISPDSPASGPVEAPKFSPSSMDETL